MRPLAATVEVTAWQTRRARAAVAWYLARRDAAREPGTAHMFCDAAQLGHFAVSLRALSAGEPRALFRVLVACTMFQRRQDVQILRILRGLTAEQVDELTSVEGLLRAADGSRCPNVKNLDRLLERCDLTKCPKTRAGVCSARPRTPCHMKAHTVWLKRYGHFGKVPTSLALVLRERGARDLDDLRQQVLAASSSPYEAAVGLEAALRACEESQ